MSEPTPPRTKIFVSYSREDTTWRERLEKHLKSLGEDDNIWIDHHSIPTGGQWRKEIESALATARGAVLLISVDFVSSDFITKYELPRLLAAAENAGVRIIPVHVKPCNIPDTLTELQAVNEPDRTLEEMTSPERDRMWLKVLDAIKSILSELVLVTFSENDRDDVDRVLSLFEREGLGIDRAAWEPSDLETDREQLLAKLKKRSTVMVFMGRDGPGPWEDPTIYGALKDKSRNPEKVITVLLPQYQSASGPRKPVPGHQEFNLRSPIDDLSRITRLWRLVSKAPWPGPTPRRPQTRLLKTGATDNTFDAAIDNLVRQLPRGDHFTTFWAPAPAFPTKNRARTRRTSLPMVLESQRCRRWDPSVNPVPIESATSRAIFWKRSASATKTSFPLSTWSGRITRQGTTSGAWNRGFTI